MSETDEQFKKALTQKISESEDIKIEVDDKHTKALEKRAEEAESERDDLKGKLEILALKALEQKKKAVEEKVNSVFKNSSKRDEMLEQIKQANPEALSNLDKMLSLFSDSKSTAKSEPSGSAPLVPAQMGIAQQAEDLAHMKFPNIETAIATLQAEKRKGNAEAERLLSLLWKKGINSWREAGHPNQSYSPDSNVAEKTTGIPEINFDDYKGTDVQGFPQIKKSPFRYSKTHNPDGSLKE